MLRRSNEQKSKSSPILERPKKLTSNSKTSKPIFVSTSDSSTNTNDGGSHFYSLSIKFGKYKDEEKQLLSEIIELQQTVNDKFSNQVQDLRKYFESLIKQNSNPSEKEALEKKLDLSLEESALFLLNGSSQFEFKELEKEFQSFKLFVKKQCNDKANFITTDNNCEAVMEIKNKLTEILQNEMKCVICKEMFVTPMITNCSHTFCQFCLEQWRKRSANCPICRCIITNSINNSKISSLLHKTGSLVTASVTENWFKHFEERSGIEL